jgi:hypothetical protein
MKEGKEGGREGEIKIQLSKKDYFPSSFETLKVADVKQKKVVERQRRRDSLKLHLKVVEKA